MPKAKTPPRGRSPAPTIEAPPPSRYREQYGVIVVCPDESAQRRIYEGLSALFGASLRVVNT